LVDDVGEASFQEAKGFQSAVAVAVGFARVISSLACGWQRAWVIAMRCRAALSRRLPVRLSRCRVRFDDQTGSGAVPLWRAVGGGGSKPQDTGRLAEDLRRGQRRAAWYGDQCGCEVLGQLTDFGFEGVEFDGQLPASIGDRGGEAGDGARQAGESVADAVQGAGPV
jgi:hypothetical protein